MTDSKKEDNEIDKETSTRICTHMNDDHAVSVYAMARSMMPHGQKISSAKLKKITLKGCEIATVTCVGDMCSMKNVHFAFEPPLIHSSQVRPKMIEIHQQVCSPQVSWLVTRPFPLSVLIVVALLGYGTHVLGMGKMADMIEARPALDSMISTIFLSAINFAIAVKCAWILALVLHVGEGLFVVYHAHTTFKLQPKPMALWFFTISCVGYPITSEFLDLLAVKQKLEEQPLSKQKNLDNAMKESKKSS